VLTILNYLAPSAHLRTGLYILLALISSVFNYSQIIQDLLDRFFHQVKCICVSFLDLDLFFDSFRDVAMATDFEHLQNDLYSTCWHFATDSNYRNSDLQVLKDTNFATFCAVLVKISPLTPEIMQGVSVPLGTR